MASFNSFAAGDIRTEQTRVLRAIQSRPPDAGIRMNFRTGIPGHTTYPGEVEMNFRYTNHCNALPVTGCETLTHDCMSGYVALYRRLDHIQTCGELVGPILDARSVLPARDFPDYAAGFRVSQAADRLLVREGRGWHPGRICGRTGYG